MNNIIRIPNTNTTVMNREKDKDLIAHLQAKENKSEYIKELVRRDLENAKAGEC